MKRYINVFEHSTEIMTALNKGVLLSAKADGRVNTMAISWGALGVEWGKPVFITFVRKGRFTRELIDKSLEFTVNIPVGEVDKHIIGVCGTKSGRDIDKFAELALTAVDGECVAAPAIKQLPLTLECKVLYRQPQERALLPEDIVRACYPADVDSSAPLANADMHIAYYGEIVKAYVLE